MRVARRRLSRPSKHTRSLSVTTKPACLPVARSPSLNPVSAKCHDINNLRGPTRSPGR